MKRYAILACVGSAFIAGLAWSLVPSPASAPHKSDLNPIDRPTPLSMQQESVGWVFGRVMGVPGAERPLMSQSGPYGHQPLPCFSPTRP